MAKCSICGNKLAETFLGKIKCGYVKDKGKSQVGEKGALLNNGCSTKELGEQGKCFPECNHDVAITEGGGLTFRQESTSITDEDIACARDRYYNRDCSGIRKEGERRIDHIPKMFECDSKIANPKLRARTSEVVTLNDFEKVTHKGDCSSIIARLTKRMQRVLRRISCLRDGKPVEELGWGEAKGGRITGGAGRY